MTGEVKITITIAVASLIFLLIPAMFWIVRRAKRRAGGFVLAYSLFFGWERMFEGATDHTELAQDPEWQQQPSSGGPPPS